jgi:L-iditol 2-dehydrogenase
MKVARLYSPEDIRIEDMPIPEVAPGEALLKTKASGICSGDTMSWYITEKAPLVLGHEPSGEIVEVGSAVNYFNIGDRVFVHHHAPCFDCKACNRGDYVQCRTWKNSGITPGGIAEYILIHQNTLENDTLSLPDNVECEDGALIEPLACVLKALKRAMIKKGDTALVIGLGAMGMLNLLCLRRFGASKVIGADMVPFRLKRALELGADQVIDASAMDTKRALEEMTAGGMADIVIVGPTSIDALRQGISCAGPGGTVVMFTPVPPGETLTIDPNELYFRDISIITSYSCGPADTADALGLIEAGEVKTSQVVTHRFPIKQAEEAYRLTKEARESLKCLIVFDETA